MQNILETLTSFTSISSYTLSINSAGWTNDTLYLNELKDIINKNNLTNITIGCYINILQIENKTNDIIYSYKNLSYNTKIPYKLEWKINDKNIINQFINCRLGKSFESEIYDKTWCLRLLPNLTFVSFVDFVCLI